VVTLGLLWIPATDQLQVQSSITHTFSSCFQVVKKNTRCYPFLEQFSNPLADKAQLLSVSNSSYNSCVKINWNGMSDFLPTCNRVGISYFKSTPEISQIKNRRLTCTTAINIQLHGFCDSSERSYRARLYSHSTDCSNQGIC
jgi:hypothetical protein